MNSKTTNILLLTIIILAIAILFILLKKSPESEYYSIPDPNINIIDDINNIEQNNNASTPMSDVNVSTNTPKNNAYVIGQTYTSSNFGLPLTITYKGMNIVEFNQTNNAILPMFVTADYKYYFDQHALQVNIGSNPKEALEALNEQIGATISEGDGSSYTVSLPEDQNIFDAVLYYESAPIVSTAYILWFGPREPSEVLLN